MSDPTPGAAFEALLARAGGDILLLVDDRLRIVRAGTAAATLAGRPEHGLAGMSLIAAFGSAALDAVARGAQADDAPASGEADLGALGERHFAIDAVPLADGVVLLLHDMTALRRAERVRRDFVANVSHELRTPLASIKLLAETLSSGTATDDVTARDFATQIERETDHLSQMVDELLELSTIESGATRLAIEPLDPDTVVASCVERIAPVADRAEVRVVSVPAATGEEVLVAGDPARLGQAMLNLAHNAVKYSRAGGEVRIGWEPSRERVRFTVTDRGVGVPAAHRARIFERFYKVDRSRARSGEDGERPGVGLGLAIVRHVAEAHGGRAGLDSTEGVGSTFWIELPRA